MSTVFLLDGYGFGGFLPLVMQGTITAGSTVIPIPYNNTIASLSNAKAAVDMIDSYLTTHSGVKKVLAISMGAQMACKWLRDKGPTSSIPPSDLSFLLLGNPERKYTGSTIVAPQMFRSYGGIGPPPGTPYTVKDYARQYDGVADFPNLTNPNPIAIWNALLGIGIVHCNYFGVTLTDSNLVSWTEGNITYVYSPTWPLPYLSAAQATIEASYSRHVTIPLH